MFDIILLYKFTCTVLPMYHAYPKLTLVVKLSVLFMNNFYFSGCIARYMNCVVFDMIHSSANPTILCLAVHHYYGNTMVPEHLNSIRSVHATLLQYVDYWLPGEIQMQDKIGYFKVFDCSYV